MDAEDKVGNALFAALIVIGCVIGACAVIVVRWLWP